MKMRGLRENLFAVALITICPIRGWGAVQRIFIPAGGPSKQHGISIPHSWVYHNDFHVDRAVAMTAYVLRGLDFSGDEVRESLAVARWHDHVDGRATELMPSVPETNARLIRDYYGIETLPPSIVWDIAIRRAEPVDNPIAKRLGTLYGVSFDGERTAPSMLANYNWDQGQFLRVVAGIQRSEFPFNLEGKHYNPFYARNKTSPIEMYRAMVALMPESERRSVMARAALFSEIPDQLNCLCSPDFRDFMIHALGLVRELRQALKSDMTLLDLGRAEFMRAKGGPNWYSVDSHLAGQFGIPDFRLPERGEILAKSSVNYSRAFDAYVAASEALWRALADGEPFYAAYKKGRRVYDRLSAKSAQ